MKKMLFAIFTCCTLILLMAATCSKSDAPAPGPAVTELNEGFLTTKTGINIGNVGDTAYLRITGSVSGPGGNIQVAETLQGARGEKKDYYIKIEKAGTNTVYIKCIKNGIYLGVRESGVTPGYYTWCTNWATLDRQPGPKNEFYIKKKGDKHFTIESALIRGAYMNTTTSPQISYTGPVSANHIHFLEKQQEWFFLKPF